MSQVAMQQTPGNSSQQHSWGSSEGISGADQGINGFDPSPWQQPLSNRWAPIGPTTGMPTLRSIMQEEQQAVLQSHGSQAQSLNNTGFNSYQYADQGRPRAPPGLTLPPAIQQQPPQQQTRQRSAGFYMNSQNRDEEESGSAAGPVTNSWAQLVRSPAVNPANISQQHGFVDLRMATEAFRDAFSATAPPMHGPPEVPQDPLMLEALKGPINHVTGNVHCLACGKGLKDHATLAQHLKDKHHNSSSADAATARGGFNLGDLMAQAQAKRAAAAAAAAVQPPAERHQKQYSAFTPGDARGMREYLKRFPNKASLAMAVHKELGSSQGKKKMSRLKRIILRERADKAAVQAGTAAETAAANLVKSRSALECLQTQLQEAEEQLNQGKIGNIPEASALTHKQVLEMAVAEASRRVQEATKKVTDAEAEAVKKNEEKAKVWRTNQPSNNSSVETTPNSSVEIVPKVVQAPASTSEPRSHSSPVETTTQAEDVPKAAAAKLQEHKSADEEYIAEQLQLMGLDPQDGYSADGDANAESDSDSSRDDPEGRGLEAFEDVLSSWLTAAHTKTSRPMVKAQASLPLRPKIVGQSGVQSTLQRIQEQQQQMVQEEAEGAVKPASKKETGGKRPAQQVAQETATAESKEDSDDEDGSGVAGWTDVMSDWMSAAGIQGRAQHAQHALVGSKPAAKVLPQQRLQVDAAATPNWLADVSSDEDSDADKKAVAKQQESGSVQAPSTASLSEAKPHKSSPPASQSPSLLNCAPGEAESAAQHAQHATVQQSISNFGLPSLPSKPAMSGNTEPASPKPALAEAMHDSSSSGASSQGVSSQDRRVVSDMMSKAQSDPPAFWPSPSQSYPALMPKGNQGPLQLPIAASSLPPPLVYSADQGLAPQTSLQALQHWKDQFRGLYNSFEAERPAPTSFLGPGPRSVFPAQPYESANTAANAHEFECAVCGVTCCGIINFEQHCTSKKHLRKAAGVAHATVSSDNLLALPQEGTTPSGPASDSANGTTYVGYQAQCRTYCKQVISAELNRVVVELLQQLLFWQERQKAQDPLKAAKKKRLVSGLREVAKAVKLRRAKTIVVAPNIEQIESEGGLDDLLGNILSQAEAAGLPVVFALSRKKMGQVFGCRKKMSAIAILDFGGANELFHQMSVLAQQGRLDYQAHASQGPGGDMPPPDLDPMALNGSDSDSDGNYQQGPVPMLYRLRADGRQVPLTEGHGMNLAHRKGLIQEVVVSPKRVPQALAEANSLFGTQTTSQPENVVLHSVELPQVQLGDREVADSAPEDGDPEQQTRQRVPQTLDLPAHPALLHLQQQRMQPHLLTNSGTHSAPLGDVASQQAVSRINSLSSLSSEYLRASERELSNHAAAAAALQAQHSSTMPQWGLPQGGVALSGNPLDSNRSHSAHMGYTNQAMVHPHGAHGSGPRSALLTSPAVNHSAPLGTGQPSFRRMPLGQGVQQADSSSRLGAPFGPLGRQQRYGNPAPAAPPQGPAPPPPLGMPGANLSPHAMPSPSPRGGYANPNAFNSILDGWQGQSRAAPQPQGHFAMQPQAMPAGIGYGGPYTPNMGFQGSLPTYGGQYLGAPPQSPHPQPQPWQQQGWQNPRAPPHMTPYPQAAARGMQQSYQQYQQQQHMMQQMPQQLNANAQEWKPTWA